MPILAVSYCTSLSLETLGPLNTSACPLFTFLGRKISISGDKREGAFLLQRVSVLVQLYNAVLLHDTLPAPDDMYPIMYICIFKFHREHIYQGLKISVSPETLGRPAPYIISGSAKGELSYQVHSRLACCKPVIYTLRLRCLVSAALCSLAKK